MWDLEQLQRHQQQQVRQQRRQQGWRQVLRPLLHAAELGRPGENGCTAKDEEGCLQAALQRSSSLPASPAALAGLRCSACELQAPHQHRLHGLVKASHAAAGLCCAGRRCRRRRLPRPGRSGWRPRSRSSRHTLQRHGPVPGNEPSGPGWAPTRACRCHRWMRRPPGGG